MDKQLVSSIIAAASVAGAANAGTEMVSEPKNPVSAQGCGDWCETLDDIGTVYEDDNNPIVQKVKFFGRAQLQYAYIQGEDAGGKKFSSDFEEVRRLRFGAEVEFLNGFELQANINLEDDEKPEGHLNEREFGYQSFDTAALEYTFENILGFDEATIGYGRYKIPVGHEAHTSSKRIKTVERSAFSNKLYDNRYTSLGLTLERGDWEGTVAVLSLEDSDFVSGWDAGKAIYVSTEFEALNGDVLLDVVYNLDTDEDEDEVGVNYEWVASAAWSGDIGGGWELMVNGAMGDNGDEDYAGNQEDGLFYGLVVMPSTYLIEDKLEFVARYQYQGSEEDEGIRLNARYFRRAEGSDDLDLGDGGRGDSHHSLYTGLNWFQCDHHSKVMAGVEYETIETDNGSADATTFWLAYRMYF